MATGKGVKDVRDAGHGDDVNIGAVFGFAGGLVLVAAGIYAVIWLLFGYFTSREAAGAPRDYPIAISQETRLPPEPRLQTNPRQDLRDMRAQEDELLGNYRWVDKNSGIVRIPIEQAMRLTVERGLPTRAKADKP